MIHYVILYFTIVYIILVIEICFVSRGCKWTLFVVVKPRYNYAILQTHCPCNEEESSKSSKYDHQLHRKQCATHAIDPPCPQTQHTYTHIFTYHLMSSNVGFKFFLNHHMSVYERKKKKEKNNPMSSPQIVKLTWVVYQLLARSYTFKIFCSTRPTIDYEQTTTLKLPYYQGAIY